MSVLLTLEEFYDAVPRPTTRVEEFGPLRLFVRQGLGWPYYARPSAPSATVGRDDVLAVRARQRELELPESFEWVHDLVPSMAQAALQAGLTVRRCPVLVLDGPLPPPPPGVTCAVLDAESADLAAAEAVASVAFAQGGTAVGPEGAAERDAVAATVSAARLEALRAGLRAGSAARAIAVLVGHSPAGLTGPLAVAGLQRTPTTAELTGVGTLPVARRRGLGGAVTGRLARHALSGGVSLVFLSAQDDAVARVYERIGFRRVGTTCLAEPGEQVSQPVILAERSSTSDSRGPLAQSAELRTFNP